MTAFARIRRAEVGLGAILIGLLQGGAFWLLHVAAQRVEGPADLPAWWAASALVAFWVPLTLIVLWAHRRNRTLWIAATGLGLFLAWSSSQLLGETSLHKGWAHAEPADIAGYLLPLILAWLIALPMLRARLESGAWRAPYALLFRCSWRSYLLLAESALFSVAFWGLLGLCAALFHTLGNDAFKQLFTDARFAYPATTVAFALATQLIGTTDRFVDAVLDQLLGLLKWLAPVAGVIVVLFGLALLPRLPMLLQSGERIMNSAWLLWLVAVTVLLLNAAYRDGQEDPGYGRLLRNGLRGVPVILVVVAATAVFSIVVRVIDHGLTPVRYWGLVAALFGLFYSVGYALAARRSVPWFDGLRRVNHVLAVLLLVTLVMSLTPYGDPRRWSVFEQAAPAPTAVTGPLKYEEWRRQLRILPAGHEVPPALDLLLKADFGRRDPPGLQQEAATVADLLLFADLDGDGKEDALLVATGMPGTPHTRVFMGSGDVWRLARPSLRHQT